MPIVIDRPPVICQVIDRRENGIATISLQITASKDAAGLYRLKVRKRDSSGQANLQQGGAFSLKGGKSQDFGVISVGITSEGDLGIEAVLTVDGEDIRCDSHDLNRI